MDTKEQKTGLDWFNQFQEEITEGKSKGSRIEIPDSLKEIITRYQKAYKDLHKKRPPNRETILILMIAKSLSEVESDIQEMITTAQKAKETQI